MCKAPCDPSRPDGGKKHREEKKEKENSMDNDEQNEYRAHVRGAATFILLGQKNPPMDAPELVRLYHLDLATASADIDAIVVRERHKVGGVFEVKTDNASAQLSKPAATDRPATAVELG
jgi:hypothetical protein